MTEQPVQGVPGDQHAQRGASTADHRAGAPRPRLSGPARRSGDRTRVVRGLAVLLAVAAVLYVVGLVLGLVVVGRHGGGPIQGWDDRVQAWQVHHRAGLVGVSKVVAFLGDAPKLAVVVTVVTLVLLAVLRTVRALVPLAAYLGGEFQVFAIRLVVHRPRPPTAVYPAPGAIPGVHESPLRGLR